MWLTFEGRIHGTTEGGELEGYDQYLESLRKLEKSGKENGNMHFTH